MEIYSTITNTHCKHKQNKSKQYCWPLRGNINENNCLKYKTAFLHEHLKIITMRLKAIFCISLIIKSIYNTIISKIMLLTQMCVLVVPSIGKM
jgi:hypothetical protein